MGFTMLSYLLTLQALSALKDKPAVGTEPHKLDSRTHTGPSFWSNSVERQPYKKRQVSDVEAVLKIANRRVFGIDEVAELLSENRSLLKAVLTVWVDKNKDGNISEEEFDGKHCR